MVSVLGGLLMIIGAIFTFKGKISHAIWAYLFADMAWIYNAILLGDVFGGFVIGTAMILGLGAYYKMSIGIMNKSLNKDLNKDKETDV